jgi:hypothetical protein
VPTDLQVLKSPRSIAKGEGVADLDLLELLAADHGNIATADPQHIVAQVAQHLRVERDLLYPAIEGHVKDASEVLAVLRQAEQSMEECLAAYEDHPTPQNLQTLRAAVEDHEEMQARLFGKLRHQLPLWLLRELADTVVFSIGGSPTHPHTHIPERGPIGEVAEELAGVADHMRDRLHREHADGSG